MAKAKTESVRAREARLKAEAELAALAEAAANEAARAAVAAKEEAARLKAEKNAPKPKRDRFVRAERVAPSEVPAAPIPAASTKPAGKLMSKLTKPTLKVAATGPNRGPAGKPERRQVRPEDVIRRK